MKILAIQNRMGIGDMVIFTPFIEAIAKKFGFPVTILVKESSKADKYLKNNDKIDNIITLDRHKNEGKHDGIIGSFRLIKDLRKLNFNKVFIFNSSLRFYLISKLAGINEIYQYPLFKKKNQHIIETAQKFLLDKIEINAESNPIINVDDNLTTNAKKKFNINENEVNILLGIGGSGPTKRVSSEKFITFINKSSENYNCRYFLATGKNSEEQKILKEIMESKFKDRFVRLDDIELEDTLPIIKNCNIAICNDSSFSHLSAAIGIPTVVLMADTPLIYGNYSPKMFPIIPDGETTVKHDTLGKSRINPDKIFEKFKSLLN